MSSKERTKALLNKLKITNPPPFPASTRPTTLDEVVALLARASSGIVLDSPEQALIPILLEQHERLSELIRKLATKGRPASVARAAREALVESTIRDVQALNGISVTKLRPHARHRTQFPAMAGGHPKWQKEINRRVADLDLGVHIPGCNLVSRSQLDVFRKAADQILDRLIHDGVKLDPARWPAIRKKAVKVLRGIMKKSPKRFQDLRKLIKSPSDQGNIARLDARVKERVLERLKTAIGANKS